MKNTTIYIVGIILVAFGLLTLYLSGSVIFDLFDMRSKQGNYVLPVIWANFIASLLYLSASYGFFFKKKWTYRLLGLAIFVLIVGAFALFLHINSGGIYMQKTIKAIVFRILITVVFFLFAYVKLYKKK